VINPTDPLKRVTASRADLKLNFLRHTRSDVCRAQCVFSCWVVPGELQSLFGDAGTMQNLSAQGWDFISIRI
jgi:hypothetical protein